DPARCLGRGRIVSKDEFLAWEPGVDPGQVAGGAVWSDAQMFSSDRLLLAFVQSAVAQDAVAVNHVEAVSLLRNGRRVTGAAVRDRLSGESMEVEARVVVNAAGAWAAPLSATAGEGGSVGPVTFAKALNLVTRLAAPPVALGSTYAGRFYFRVPWRGVSIFGTSQDAFDDHPDRLGVSAGDVSRLLASINAVFPGSQVLPEDVTLVHRGLLPSTGRSSDGEAILAKSSIVRDHGRSGVDGLVTVVGVRYTTARETAEEAVDAACRLLGGQVPPSHTATAPLAGSDFDSVSALLASATADRTTGLDSATLERLARSYGSAYRSILQRIVRDPELGRPLAESGGVTAAEVVHAVDEEMALTLSDALARRTEAGAAGWPGDDAVRRGARLMARRLGWNAERTGREIDALRAMYP
ncbi:MAG: FAD-dependent oxidoreductase, partial [Acidobacteria bacterium]